ncbi:hypothetical protein ACLOJK_007362 [Asimina triloba]
MRDARCSGGVEVAAREFIKLYSGIQSDARNSQLRGFRTRVSPFVAKCGPLDTPCTRLKRLKREGLDSVVAVVVVDDVSKVGWRAATCKRAKKVKLFSRICIRKPEVIWAVRSEKMQPKSRD